MVGGPWAGGGVEVRGERARSRVTKWRPKKASFGAENGSHLVNSNCYGGVVRLLRKWRNLYLMKALWILADDGDV